MHRALVVACLISCIASGIFVECTIAQPTDSIRLKCVRVERVDAEHFKAVVELINETKSDIYIQSALDRSDTPYPLYLERRVAKDEWQIVAPCVDLMPAGAIAIRRGKSLTVDLVHSLKLPSTCRIRKIDTSGEYRWRIEYFRNKEDLMEYERTEGRSGKALSAVSNPFRITPGAGAPRQ
jgi:hypothetical protein